MTRFEIQGIPIAGPNNGTVYFVDNNSGNDGNSGKTWKAAFKTLARAVTLNNVDIARGSDRWARRNTIYYTADTETATLIAFPNKCDVIGVGSYDANSKPGITGHHAPVNAGNYGTRFFNIWFKGKATATPIVTLASTSSGIQFHGCTLDGVVGTVTTAITATASPFLQVINCDIFGGFATGYLNFGIGDMARTVIQGNTMTGLTGIGIATVDTTTSSYASYLKDNFIAVVGNNKCVNDVANSDTGILYAINNRFISDGATVTAIAHYAAVVNLNLTRAAGNICMGSSVRQVTCPEYIGS
jgi:hypothetical protein